jgi:hypothetical protein
MVIPLLSLLIFLDGVTTHLVLSSGRGYEGNPFAAGTDPVLSSALLAAFVLPLSFIKARRFLTVFLAPHLVVRAVTVVHNLYVYLFGENLVPLWWPLAVPLFLTVWSVVVTSVWLIRYRRLF